MKVQKKVKLLWIKRQNQNKNLIYHYLKDLDRKLTS